MITLFEPSNCDCPDCSSFNRQYDDKKAVLDERITPIIKTLETELERMGMSFVVGIRPMRDQANCAVYVTGEEGDGLEENENDLLILAASVILACNNQKDFADFCLQTGLLARMGEWF